MEKILVLSDIHYPLPESEFFEEIINDESPDKVFLLGDNVDNYGTTYDLLDLYKEFIDKFSAIFQLEKTAIIIGDNDYQGDDRIVNYINSLNKLNNNAFAYTYKNLFLFHGNIENGNHIMEILGKYTGLAMKGINKTLLPELLMKRIRSIYNIDGDKIVLAGHIHYLGYVKGGVFCGTLNTEPIIYKGKDSLGYITIQAKYNEISYHDIKIHRIIS